MPLTTGDYMRAVEWFARRTPFPQYTAHIMGPVLSASPGDPAMFMTFVLLYPGSSRCVVFTGNPPTEPLATTDEIKQVIANLRPSERQFLDQRRVGVLQGSIRGLGDEGIFGVPP